MGLHGANKAYPEMQKQDHVHALLSLGGDDEKGQTRATHWGSNACGVRCKRKN